ncbi:hypothetical protein A2W24_00310 [Microgenomates group bacterium RBG_16_45_19]|nr:MAG: hypothetical protein A2W24_00310 [Microgenomates group bacterium RBG_16_45_19]
MINYPLSVYTDGAARSNPGPAAAAFLIYDATRVILEQGGRFLGHQTNNEAEYQGVILALDALTPFVPESPQTVFTVNFYSDSQLIVNQLAGRFKIKQPHLKDLVLIVHQKIQFLHLTPTFTAIPRTQNAAADALVNRILDQPSL